VALVNLKVARLAQSRHQVVIGLDASSFAAAPIGVCCLDAF
jgi:hypothetical protein